MYELEQLTVKELKSKLVELGIPEAEAAHFLTKGQIIATIKTLMAKKEVVTEHEEVKRVASLEEKPNPIEDREINKAWKDKAKRMKEHLEAQEKVNILIPTEPGEKPGVVEEKKDKNGETYQVHVSGAVESVQLNGYKYFIPKGKYVPVPKQIAEVISDAQQQTLEAGQDFSVSRTDPNTGRPINESL